MDFFIDDFGLTQDDGGAAHGPAPEDVLFILACGIKPFEDGIDVVLFEQSVGGILALAPSTSGEVERADVVGEILEVVGDGQHLQLVGAKPMRIDDAGVADAFLDEHGGQGLSPFVLEGELAAGDLGVAIEEVVERLVGVVVFPALDDLRRQVSRHFLDEGHSNNIDFELIINVSPL